MQFVYTKQANIEIGQKLYGIIADTIRTYGGVYPVVVDEIKWDDEEIIFKIDQPCHFVSCMFCEMEDYVFETESEAQYKMRTLDSDLGMFEY